MIYKKFSYAIKVFLSGFNNLKNFSPNIFFNNFFKVNEKETISTDWRNISKDWENIGNNMRNSILKYDRKQTDK